MTELPSWAFRDLETAIGWLLNASTNVAEIEDDPNISRQTRELASDARTHVKGALMLLREIRSQHENLVTTNGEAKAG